MTKENYEIMKMLVTVVFAMLVVAFFPLGVLWAIQTLFPVVVLQYNFYNWAAVLIMGIFFRGYRNPKKD